MSRALTYAMTSEEVLRITTERAAELLETPKSILLLTDDNGDLSVRASFGLDADVARRYHEPLTEKLIVQLRQLLDVPPERFLGVPMVVGGEVTGLLAVALQPGVTSSSVEHEWLLSAVADQAAVALEKAHLEERATFRDRLIGIVSHDLRTPIGAILMGVSLLLETELDNLDEQAIKVLTRIRSSAERASRMIVDLLDYTQAHLGGGIRVDRKLGSVHTLIRQVVAELEVAHPDRAFEIVHEGDPRAQFDVDRMGQVLGNLVSNAVHHGRAGTPIRVALRGEDASVLLSVQNQGRPIPPEHLRGIFEPMQQLHPHASIGQRSVGLGSTSSITSWRHMAATSRSSRPPAMAPRSRSGCRAT
ncbi:MAG: GAF domain-containing protein [Myxococcales bacterium]|nr:GAF domain-containing protein [Myxococcales bacterium]